MKYMGDLEFWDQKFKDRDQNILGPEMVLVDRLSLFKQGSVLDIACGDGRNSLFLLSKGFQVTGIDFSAEALKRLHDFAAYNNYSVDTLQKDLTVPNWMESIDVFDNMIICHYRLQGEQMGQIHKYLKVDGILFITGFGDKHQVDSRIGEKDLIRPYDFRALEMHFEKIEYNEYEDDRGSFVVYIFKKK